MTLTRERHFGGTLEQLCAYKLIGEKILEARKKQNMSQAALGGMIGVNGQTIHKYEGGYIRLDVFTLLRIADALDYNVLFFTSGVTTNVERNPT